MLAEAKKRMSALHARPHQVADIEPIFQNVVMFAGVANLSVAIGQSLATPAGFVMDPSLFKTMGQIEDEFRKSDLPVPDNIHRYLTLLYILHEYGHGFPSPAKEVSSKFDELATDLPSGVAILDIVNERVYPDLTQAGLEKVIPGEYGWDALQTPTGDETNDGYGISSRAILGALNGANDWQEWRTNLLAQHQKINAFPET
jgi:hypothetical protein